MTIPRVPPLLYSVWLAKLLVSDSSCEWATWFKANHDEFPRRPNTYNDPQAKIKHTSLLMTTRKQFISEGHAVAIENQNLVKSHGRVGRGAQG